MKISIITATFNSGATVRDTLDSVLKQNYTNYELIIKDGGSKDNTMEICREYEQAFEGRLRIISCPDKGIYDAMNQGIKAATGDVVGILNSDDLYIDENILGDIASAFERNDVGCVYGNLYFVDAEYTNKVTRRWIGSQHYKGAFQKGWHPAHPTFYAKREYYEVFGGFDTTFDVSADFELMLRFIEKNEIKSLYMDRYFIRMRIGGESTGSLSKIITGNRNVLRAFKKNGIEVSALYPMRRILPKIKDRVMVMLKLSK